MKKAFNLDPWRSQDYFDARNGCGRPEGAMIRTDGRVETVRRADSVEDLYLNEFFTGA